MTANIQQNVVPRRRSNLSFSHHISAQGEWQTRQRRTATPWQQTRQRYFEQGSVTQSTVTVTFSLMALVIVSLLGFFYLQQVFGTASQGSDVQALESEMSDLREQQKALELEGAQLRSIQAVDQRVKELNLVSVDRVAYLAQQHDKVAVVSR